MAERNLEGDIVEVVCRESHLSLCVNAQTSMFSRESSTSASQRSPGNGKEPFVAAAASEKKRTDTDITYPLDEYASDPVHISNAETIEPSYDKRRRYGGRAHGAE